MSGREQTIQLLLTDYLDMSHAVNEHGMPTNYNMK
jgi:hypothetical protein